MYTGEQQGAVVTVSLTVVVLCPFESIDCRLFDNINGTKLNCAAAVVSPVAQRRRV